MSYIYIYIFYIKIEKYMANRPDVLVEDWALGPNLPFWGLDSMYLDYQVYIYI